MILIVS